VDTRLGFGLVPLPQFCGFQPAAIKQVDLNDVFHFLTSATLIYFFL
jgi:hypothetical protein